MFLYIFLYDLLLLLSELIQDFNKDEYSMIKDNSKFYLLILMNLEF